MDIIEGIKNCKISTEEIKSDIADTQKEIDQYENEISVLIKDRHGNRLDIYMREGKVSARKDFINKLKSILEYRENSNQ